MMSRAEIKIIGETCKRLENECKEKRRFIVDSLKRAGQLLDEARNLLKDEK